MLESLPILPILLFSIVVHEISHGLMALKLGDPTAKDLGRLTLNPLPHIDPIGSVIVPLASYLMAGTVFIAWAKPVPVNPMNFQNVRRDDILVSIVGPFSNLFVALGCALLYVMTVKLFGPQEVLPPGFEREAVVFLTTMFSVGITINIFLAVFNLIPVPPLDGSHVVASLLPEELGEKYRRIGFFGIVLILVLMRLDPFRHAVLFVVRGLLIPYQIVIESLL